MKQGLQELLDIPHSVNGMKQFGLSHTDFHLKQNISFQSSPQFMKTQQSSNDIVRPSSNINSVIKTNSSQPLFTKDSDIRKQMNKLSPSRFQATIFNQERRTPVYSIRRSNPINDILSDRPFYSPQKSNFGSIKFESFKNQKQSTASTNQLFNKRIQSQDRKLSNRYIHSDKQQVDVHEYLQMKPEKRRQYIKTQTKMQVSPSDAHLLRDRLNELKYNPTRSDKRRTIIKDFDQRKMGLSNNYFIVSGESGNMVECLEDTKTNFVTEVDVPKIESTQCISSIKEVDSKEQTNKHLENKYLPKKYSTIQRVVRPPSPYIKDGDKEVPLKLLALNKHMRKLVEYLMDNGKNEKLTYAKIKEMKIQNIQEVKKMFINECKLQLQIESKKKDNRTKNNLISRSQYATTPNLILALPKKHRNKLRLMSKAQVQEEDSFFNEDNQ